MPNANPSEPPDSRQAVTAIVRRARNLTATESVAEHATPQTGFRAG